MLNSQVPNSLIDKLSEQIADALNFNTLEFGLDYFRKGRIKQITLKDSTVEATVRGSGLYNGLYKVSIDLNDFIQSHCSCPDRKNCKHIAATFFNLYTKQHRPETFFRNYTSKKMGQAYTEPMKQPDSNESLDLPVKQNGNNKKSAAAASKNNNTGVKSKPRKEVDLWYDHFEKTYNWLIKGNEQISHWGFYFNHIYLYEAIFTKFCDTPYPLSQDWPKEKTEIYRMNAIIFFLAKLEKLNESKDNSQLIQVIFNRYTKDLLDSMPKTLTIEKKDEYVQYLIKAVNIINRHLLLNAKLKFDWLYFFRIMWSTVFNHQIWINRVYDLLEDVRKKAETSSSKYYYVSLGLAHFKVMAQRDDEAIALLQGLEFSSIKVFDDYLSSFSQSEEWDRLLAWLRWLSPLVEQASVEDFETVCEYWLLAAENTDALEEVEKQLRTWLPRSCNIYAEFLLENKKYSDWTDLHICYSKRFLHDVRSSHLDGVSSYELSLIEQDLQALIPLYHYRVVRYLDEKNRKAYQEAVKLLKKLRAVYNKLKLKDEWKNFILRLVNHYSRNKAFHEELRKGKLIT